MKTVQRKFNLFGILLVITVLIGLVIQYSYLNNKLREDRELVLIQSRDQLSNKIHSNMRYHSQYTIAAGLFISMNSWEEEKIVEYFSELMKSNPTIKYIYYGQPNNKLIITHKWDPQSSYDLRERQWYIKAVEEDKVFISDIYLDAIDNNPVVAISKAVYNSNEELLGVVALDISAENMIKMVEESKIKETGYSFLMDGAGNILAHPKYKYEPNGQLVNINSISNGIHNEIKISKSGQIQTEFDGVRGYLTYEPIENTNWIIGNFISLNEFRDNNWDLWRIFFMVIFISILIFVFFTYLQRVNFINPVSKLDKDIRLIGMEENIGYRLPIDEKDSFLDLRITINDVLNKSQEYFEQTEQDTEEIVAQNEELEASYEELIAIEQELRQQYEKLVTAEKELAYLSYHDQLTGLYNRRFFEEELKRLDVSRNLPISIIMADVNGLKLINDSFGHDAGDEHLRNIANIMKEGCRQDDIIARLSGDEFIIILPRTTEREAKGIIERLIKLSKHEKFADENILSMDLSIAFGLGIKYTEETDMKDVLKMAEDRMYAQKIFEGQRMRRNAIDAMINSLHSRSIDEEKHSNRVSLICEEMGVHLGMSQEKIEELKTIGNLHDIGKISIDKSVLNKPGPLTPSEWEEIKKHPEIGYRILSTVNKMSKVAEYVLYHHERYDGKGYPKGLKGEEIPLVSRILAIADAYDSMVSDRPYRKALGDEEILKEFIDNAGTQFDPKLTRIFVEKVLGHNYK